MLMCAGVCHLFHLSLLMWPFCSTTCGCRLLGVDVYHFDFKLYHIAQHVQVGASGFCSGAGKCLGGAVEGGQQNGAGRAVHRPLLHRGIPCKPV